MDRRAPAMTELIARALGGVYARHMGKGPSSARATLDGDLVTCVLEGVLTTREHTLVTVGKASDVREARIAFHEVLGDELRQSVQEITGVSVRSSLSQIDPDANLAVEVFVLERAVGDPDASVADLRQRRYAASERREELSEEALAVRRQSEQAVRRAKELTGKQHRPD